MTWSDDVIAALPDGVLVEDRAGLIACTNSAFTEMFSIPAPPEALLGLVCAEAAAGAASQFADSGRWVERTAEILRLRTPIRDEVWQVKDGRWFSRDFVPLVDADGSASGNMWVYRDVTSTRNRDLNASAANDAMAGLLHGTRDAANTLADDGEQYTTRHKAIQRMSMAGSGAAGTLLLLSLDLDDIAWDVLHVHRVLAERLASECQTIYVASIDESTLVALCPNVQLTPETIRRARMAITDFTGIGGEMPPVRIAGAAFSGGTSMMSMALAMSDAEAAMLEARRRDRDMVFSHAMRERDDISAKLVRDLPKALRSGELYLAYQPIVALEGMQVAGYEALARWAHPTLGELSGGRFVPLAEESEFIIDVDLWGLGRALADGRVLMGTGATGVGVNVSARHLAHGDLLVRAVDGLVAQSPLDYGNLVLEVTETTAVYDMANAVQTLTALRELGVQIAIDDFGAGYSSLAHLGSIPADYLKLDKLFSDAIQEPRIQSMVKSVHDIAATFGTTIVAEGIETQEQLDIYRGLGIEHGQGWFLGLPKRIEDFPSLASD